jgi:hypothetical protein
VFTGVLGTALTAVLVGLLLIFHSVPAPTVQIDRAAAERFADELQHAQSTAASGLPAVVRADETELNSMLQSYLHVANAGSSGADRATFRDMKFSLSEDRIRIYALLSGVGPKDITLVFEGKVRTMNGYLDFEPISGKIGSLPIPHASMKRALQQLAADAGNHQLLHLTIKLKSGHNRLRTKLGLPELEQAKIAVIVSFRSFESQRSYRYSIDEFEAWYCSTLGLLSNKCRMAGHGSRGWRSGREGRIEKPYIVPRWVVVVSRLFRGQHAID